MMQLVLVRLWDVSEKAEHYSNLMIKYLKDAEAFLAKGDYIHASEKLWGDSLWGC